ncbi:putative integrase [Escherichia coli]|nr:putative integrase [Escherichia coli]
MIIPLRYIHGLIATKKILASRGIKQKTLINYMSKIKAIRRGLPDAPLEDITTKEIAAMLNGYIDEGKAGVSQVNQINTERCIPRGNS